MSFVSSKYNQWKSGWRLTNKLSNSIGPESVIGAEHQAEYYKKIKDMVKSGKQFKAVEYAKKEKEKVDKQVFQDRFNRIMNK